MFVLGVNISHHPSIALLEDGEMLYYMEDDRYNGHKEEEWTRGSMMRCLMDILKYTSHVDHVIFASYGKIMFIMTMSIQTVMSFGMLKRIYQCMV